MLSDVLLLLTLIAIILFQTFVTFVEFPRNHINWLITPFSLIPSSLLKKHPGTDGCLEAVVPFFSNPSFVGYASPDSHSVRFWLAA